MFKKLKIVCVCYILRIDLAHCHRAAHCGDGQECSSHGEIFRVVSYQDRSRSTTRTVASCQNGYELHNSECIKYSFVQPTLSCKHHQILKNGRCYKTLNESASLRCSENTELVDNYCVKKMTFDPQKVCPENSKLVNGQCEFAPSDTDVCPKGMEFTAQGSCRYLVQYPATPKCDAGWDFKKSQKKTLCVKQISTEPQIVCLDQDVCRDGTCIAVKRDRPRLSCPNHKYRLETLANGQTSCVEHREIDSMARCDSGTLSNGKCLAADFVAPDKRCDDEFVMENNICIKRIIIEPHVSCPNNSKPFNNSCVREILHEPNFICEKGSIFNNNKKLCQVRQKEAPTQVCPDEYVLVEGLCIQQVHVAPSYKCGKDEERIGGLCVKYKKSNSALIRQCPGGHLLGGKCIMEEYADPIISCNNNSQMDEIDRCVEIVSDDIRYSCKKGLLVGNKCRKSYHQPALSVCPPNSTPKSHGKCEAEICYEAEPGCPNGSVYEDRVCVVTRVLDSVL